MPRRYTKDHFKDRNEWLQARPGFIGGSDVARIVGLSRFGDALSVYVAKTQPVAAEPAPDFGPMYWGNKLERAVMDGFSEMTGCTVKPNGLTLYRDRKHPIFACTPDGIITDNARRPMGLEVKTSRIVSTWPKAPVGEIVEVGDGESGECELPSDVFCQVQWSLGITGFSCWYIAALLQGNDLRVYRVLPNQSDIDYLQTHAELFWEEHMEPKEPPAPTAHGKPGDLLTLYPAAGDGDALELNDETAARWCADYLEAQDAIKAATGAKEFASMKIKSMLQDSPAASITHDGKTWIAKWANRAGSVRFNAKEFKAKHPDLHKEFSTRGASMRAFTIKPEKGNK